MYHEHPSVFPIPLHWMRGSGHSVCCCTQLGGVGHRALSPWGGRGAVVIPLDKWECCNDGNSVFCAEIEEYSQEQICKVRSCGAK